MHRVLSCVFPTLLGLLIVLSPRPAAAGEYRYERYDDAPVRYESGYRYDDGYVHRPRYRSPDCCYRRVVHYERVYRDYERPYYRRTYHTPYYGERSYVTTRYYDSYERPHYRPHYHARPYYGTRYYDGYRPYYRPYRPYYSRPYYGTTYYGAGYHHGYGGAHWRYADQPRRFYPPGCRPVRVKVYDDGGGWVWGKRAVC